MTTLPDLVGWAIFAKVAETGSFAKAAADLSLSQATVSKTITRLESRMNTTLFHRTSRSMALTESGHVALERAARILGEGEAVEAEVAEKSTALCGKIRLTAPMSFGVSYLAPMLPDFMRAHPDVELEIEFNDKQADLVAERFDLALRISNLVDSSLLARRLCSVRMLLVGAPSYFERAGRPAHPRDLAQHTTLQYMYLRSGSSWRFRHKEHGDFSQTIPPRLNVNNSEALAPALQAGLGLALQPEFLAWDAIKSGTLETVMEDWQADPIALHIVTPPGRKRPARVQALIAYLAERLVAAPWASGIE